MKPLFTLAVLICAKVFCLAQTPSLGISPDPALHVQCPDVELTYIIQSWAPGCHSLEPLENGTLISEKTSSSNHTIVVRWNDSPEPGKLSVHRSDSIGCNWVAPGRTWDVPIASIAGLKPVITGPSKMPLSPFDLFEYSARLNHHQHGTEDADPLPVTKFEWDIPANWIYFFPAPSNTGNIKIFPDTSEGCIRVRGQRNCGVWSDWETICPERVLPSLCPLFVANTELPCGASSILAVSTVDFSFAFPDIQYEWTLPEGWKILNTLDIRGSGIILQTDRIHDGTVGVTATAVGKVSEPCTVDFHYIPASTNAEVGGPDDVCTDGTFFLTPYVPDATSTWKVRPFDPGGLNPFLQTNGSGSIATLTLANPDMNGIFIISFTIADSCGTVVKEKKFHAGKPRFYPAKIDSDPFGSQMLCAGNHRLEINAEGTGDCMEWTTGPEVWGYPECRHFDFRITDRESPCLDITARATNICGVSEQPFHFCQDPGCEGAEQFDLSVYPNPTNFVVIIEGKSTDANNPDLALIEHLEIYDQLGRIVYQWNEAPRKRIALPVDTIPEGTYIIRATVWGNTLAKPLVISKRL